MPATFAARLRAREPLVGYWVSSDNPPATERIALAGYDYVCLDIQHGLLDEAGALRGVMAAELGGSAGVIRVAANEPARIFAALDTGARAVIVPLVESADEAAAAAAACRYPPAGARSYGPTRSALRIGPAPRAADAEVACIVMIETRAGLQDAAAICAVDGVDAIYVGPSDLGLSLGGETPAAAWARPEFDVALEAIRTAAHDAGIACGLHVVDGAAGARALADGFDFVSVSSDLTHLSQIASAHLADARGKLTP